MIYTQRELRRIYDRTTGYCHICRKKLAFKNYGCPARRAPWEVEHSTPRARAGTDSYANLYAACISCNRIKGASSTACARREYGHTRAPLSRAARESAKTENAFVGAGLGFFVGRLLSLTPGGLLVSALLGAYMASKSNPDDHPLAG